MFAILARTGDTKVWTLGHIWESLLLLTVSAGLSLRRIFLSCFKYSSAILKQHYFPFAIPERNHINVVHVCDEFCFVMLFWVAR